MSKSIIWLLREDDDSLRDEVADVMFEAVMNAMEEPGHPLEGRDFTMFSLLGDGPDDLNETLRRGYWTPSDGGEDRP